MPPIKDATPRWALLRRYRVQAHGITYLTRFAIFQTPLFGIWLHRIHRKDDGGSPHNHPWTFASFILHGGYVEKLWPHPHISTRYADGLSRTHKRFSMKRFSHKWAHQIQTVEPNTISLVFVGRHYGKWGFFTWGGFKEWDEAPTLKPSYGSTLMPYQRAMFQSPRPAIHEAVVEDMTDEEFDAAVTRYMIVYGD